MTEDTLLVLIILAFVWSIPWKGVALWKSARNRQLGWFIALLVLNTLALLEIVYLSFFQKENQVIHVKASPKAVKTKPKKKTTKPTKPIKRKKR